MGEGDAVRDCMKGILENRKIDLRRMRKPRGYRKRLGRRGRVFQRVQGWNQGSKAGISKERSSRLANSCSVVLFQRKDKRQKIGLLRTRTSTKDEDTRNRRRKYLKKRINMEDRKVERIVERGGEEEWIQ